MIRAADSFAAPAYGAQVPHVQDAFGVFIFRTLRQLLFSQGAAIFRSRNVWISPSVIAHESKKL